MRGLLDTSVFIAGGQGRELDTDRLPDQAAISVVTLAELELGVHLAGSEETRGRRLRTLQAAQTTYVALPADEAVASAFAELVASAPSHRPPAEGPGHLDRGNRPRPRRRRLHAGWRPRRPGRRRGQGLAAEQTRHQLDCRCLAQPLLPHPFKAPAPCRILEIISPGGFERFFKESAEAMESPEFDPTALHRR